MTPVGLYFSDALYLCATLTTPIIIQKILYGMSVQSSRGFVAWICGLSSKNFKQALFLNVLGQKEKAGSFPESTFINLS
jgi:hypothetical protein